MNMATTPPNIDLSKQINQAKEDFLRDVDKLRALEAMDRAQLAAAFERQAEKLIREEVKPVVQQILLSVAVAAHNARNQAPPPPPAPPAPPPPGGGGGDTGGDLPRRVDRLEGKVDKMADDIGEIKVSLGRVNERLDHMATTTDIARLDGRFDQLVERLKHMPHRAEMYLAGGAALAMLLGVMAKGFGWL